MQKQVLGQAIDALDNIPVERRSQTSMTMAVSRERLPEAMECIRRFRREMSGILKHGDERDAVYQLSVSLFPVTRDEVENPNA